MDYGSASFSHIPYLVLDKAPGEIRFYYGVVITKDGVPHIQPASLDYIEAVRKRAPGGEQEAWKYHGVEMARKTALKYACKYVQLTADVQALLADEDAQPPAAPDDAQHAATVRELWGEDRRGRAVFSRPSSADDRRRRPATAGAGAVAGPGLACGTHRLAAPAAPRSGRTGPSGPPGPTRLARLWPPRAHLCPGARRRISRPTSRPVKRVRIPYDDD